MSLFQFRQDRPAARLYKDWAAFAQQDENGTVDLGDVMAKAQPRLQPSPADGRLAVENGVPWLTVVLGSGCLLPPADTCEETAMRLAAEVDRTLISLLESDFLKLTDSDPVSAQSRRGDAQLFVTSLALGRLGEQWIDPTKPVEATRSVNESTDDKPEPSLDDSIAALAALATALLSRLFHVLSALVPSAISRTGEDVAYFSARLARNAALTQGQLDINTTLTHARLCLQELDRHLVAARRDRGGKFARVHTTLQEHVNRILSTLRGPDDKEMKLASLDINLMSELTWYLLGSKEGVYPGWSDLMLHLSIHGEMRPVYHGAPRPTITKLSAPVETIRNIYRPIADDHWAAASSASAGRVPDLIGAVADVLRAQVEFREACRGKAPLACALSTTFDLELEMELLRRRNPFVVAMPVHVLIERGTTKYASLAWIGCRVDPGQGDDDSTTSDLLLTSLVEPTAWFLLEEGQVAEFIDDENLPVVIRLNGCPLITLPTDLSTDHEALLNDLKPKIGLRDNDEVQLDHALVIDEYSAMVHSMADVFSDPTNERFGLPPALLRVPSAFSLGGNDRFWAVLGVQVGDHGVRHRVAMQLAARDLTLDDDNRLQRPAKSGIVVNRRMGTAEGELFFWQGFDVILDDCAGATEPFQHYAKSLVAPGPDDERRQRSPR